MNESKNALTIIKAIIHLAKNLSLNVTAEGIESRQQALTLHALGCEQGQGFYLGRPSSGLAEKGNPIKSIRDRAGAGRLRA
jgi:EAL domain-containing protein (putative c-di-GMP-specific phosphodiesterase class I)